MNLRIYLDILLLGNLLFLMAYPLFDMWYHVAGGIFFFILLAIHHWLNRRWGKSLSRGRWTGKRFLETVVNAGLAVIFLLLLYSGLYFMQRNLSLHVLPGSMMMARAIHLWCAYAGFLLAAIHLGLHGQMVISLCRKWTGNRSWAIRGMSLLMMLMTAYGIWAFIHRQWSDYLFLQTHFMFFDFTEKPLPFFADHLAILMAAAWLAWKFSGR